MKKETVKIINSKFIAPPKKKTDFIGIFFLMGIALAACLCTGCMCTYFRPLDAKSLTNAQISATKEIDSGVGITFYLIDPPSSLSDFIESGGSIKFVT